MLSNQVPATIAARGKSVVGRAHTLPARRTRIRRGCGRQPACAALPVGCGGHPTLGRSQGVPQGRKRGIWGRARVADGHSARTYSQEAAVGSPRARLAERRFAHRGAHETGWTGGPCPSLWSREGPARSAQGAGACHAHTGGARACGMRRQAAEARIVGLLEVEPAIVEGSQAILAPQRCVPVDLHGIPGGAA